MEIETSNYGMLKPKGLAYVFAGNKKRNELEAQLVFEESMKPVDKKLWIIHGWVINIKAQLSV